MPECNGRFFIEVELPAPIHAISALLRAAGEHWPDAKIDLNHPGGWKIKLTPADLKDKGHG